jgi:hypothetical protein
LRSREASIVAVELEQPARERGVGESAKLGIIKRRRPGGVRVAEGRKQILADSSISCMYFEGGVTTRKGMSWRGYLPCPATHCGCLVPQPAVSTKIR